MIKTKIVLTNGKSFNTDLDEKTQMGQYFKLYELANNKGNKTQVQYVISDKTQKLVAGLDELRSKLGKPITVNSCYRQKQYNASVGGDANSAHLQGYAADLKFPKLTDSYYATIKKNWQVICYNSGVYGAINRYTNGVHVEMYTNECFGTKTEFTERNYVGKKGDW